MSRQKRPSERRRDKVEAGDAGDDGVPMERFKNLTKRLLGVSNAAVQEERRRVDQKRGSTKKS